MFRQNFRPITKNNKFNKSSVFICGTSPEIEIFNDTTLVNTIENKYPILAINTAYVYFNHVSTLFLSGRFKHLTDDDFIGKKVDEIFTTENRHNFRSIKTNVYSLVVDKENFCDKIETDINRKLPHGPTALLDIVFPFCAFNEVSNIYILGCEYQKDPNIYTRHSLDSKILDRSIPAMDKQKELDWSHRKLEIWNDFFKQRGVNCYALSEKSETPFIKLSIYDI